jgi:hypothetical protein
MENYFNYFTAIEEHFQKRRGTPTLLSPLDWALIESFQEAGIPLEAVLRGIDLAFDKHGRRKSKVQKVNSLSYCTQAVLSEFERLLEGSVGKGERTQPEAVKQDTERENLAEMMQRTLEQLKQVPEKARNEGLALPTGFVEDVATLLCRLRQEVLESQTLDYEQLELRLCTMEERILGALAAALNDEAMLGLRTEVQQELSRHRRGLKAEQLAMLEKKMMSKKLLEKYSAPRLSLFYMPLN